MNYRRLSNEMKIIFFSTVDFVDFLIKLSELIRKFCNTWLNLIVSEGFSRIRIFC